MDKPFVPWIRALGTRIFTGHRANDPDLRFVARAETAEDADRIIACVNAMAGIEDPAAFVEKALELRAILEKLATAESVSEIGDARIQARVVLEIGPTNLATVGAAYTDISEWRKP